MDLNGVILIDKPAGITSAGVVSRLKHRFGVNRIGHAGTLDPMATGLLVILCGKATKLQSTFMGSNKTYEGTIKLGFATDMDDVTGKVIATSEKKILPENFEETVTELERLFSGVQLQRPPSYSALKINGKRSYKLSRKGETVIHQPREITVHSTTFRFLAPDCLSYTIKCSKGTYIRSIARDIGEHLRTLGCLESIRRLESEPFKCTDAILLDDVTEEKLIPPHFLPIPEISQNTDTDLPGDFLMRHSTRVIG